MNPQSDQAPGLRLPQPSFDIAQAPVAHAAESFRSPEAPAEAAPMPSPTPVMSPVAPTVSPIAAQPQSIPVPAAMSVTGIAPTTQGDDESALDQEWVAKAREIVERTHADPYLQSKELGKIKAQYIKVRYNKDIKVED